MPRKPASPAALPAPSSLAVLAKEWEDAYQTFKTAQAKEIAARLRLAALIPRPKEGTNRFAQDDLELVLTAKFNYSIDRAALDASRAAWPEGLLDKAIRFNPEVVLGEFRKLTADELKHVAPVVSIKPGLPSVEIVRKGEPNPKSKRK